MWDAGRGGPPQAPPTDPARARRSACPRAREPRDPCAWSRVRAPVAPRCCHPGACGDCTRWRHAHPGAPPRVGSACSGDTTPRCVGGLRPRSRSPTPAPRRPDLGPGADARGRDAAVHRAAPGAAPPRTPRTAFHGAGAGGSEARRLQHLSSRTGRLRAAPTLGTGTHRSGGRRRVRPETPRGRYPADGPVGVSAQRLLGSCEAGGPHPRPRVRGPAAGKNDTWR